MNHTVRVVIVDDDQLFVEGIASLLSQWVEFDLVGRGYSADCVMGLCSRMRPSVLIIGATLDDKPSAPTIAQISERFPEIGITCLASAGEADCVIDALRAGATSYAARNELSANRLRAFCWAAACGDVSFSGSVTGTLVQALSTTPSTMTRDSRLDSLSERELSVLALVVEGCSNAEIADRLFLSEPTIKKTISILMDKFQVSNRVQMAVAAVRMGIDQRN